MQYIKRMNFSLDFLYFIKPHSHPSGFNLGSPMLMDPHLSQCRFHHATSLVWTFTLLVQTIKKKRLRTKLWQSDLKSSKLTVWPMQKYFSLTFRLKTSNIMILGDLNASAPYVQANDWITNRLRTDSHYKWSDFYIEIQLNSSDHLTCNVKKAF